MEANEMAYSALVARERELNAAKVRVYGSRRPLQPDVNSLQSSWDKALLRAKVDAADEQPLTSSFEKSKANVELETAEDLERLNKI
jgi:hypothetical protein